MGTDRGWNTKKVGGARKPLSKNSTALILVEKYSYKKQDEQVSTKQAFKACIFNSDRVKRCLPQSKPTGCGTHRAVNYTQRKPPNIDHVKALLCRLS